MADPTKHGGFLTEDDLFKNKSPKVKLATIYKLQDEDGTILADAGSVWNVKLHPLEFTTRTAETIVHQSQRLMHKVGRPYLVVSTKEFHNSAKMAIIIPFTSSISQSLSSNRYRTGFILNSNIITNTPYATKKGWNEDIDVTEKLDVRSIISVSTDRLASFIGIISQNDLNAVKDKLIDIFSPSTIESQQRLYPLSKKTDTNNIKK